MLEKTQRFDEFLGKAIDDYSVTFIQPEKPMTITGLQPGGIQAKLAEIKERAQQRQADGLAKLEAAHTQGLAKVDAEMDKAVQKINKEVDDSLQEFAAFTNGGPT